MPEKGYNDWVRLTASGIAVEEPCYFYGVGVTAKAAACAVTVYSGRSTSAPVFFTFKTLANHTNFEFCATPLLMPGGIYISLDANTNDVLVVYRVIKPGEVE